MTVLFQIKFHSLQSRSKKWQETKENIGTSNLPNLTTIFNITQTYTHTQVNKSYSGNKAFNDGTKLLKWATYKIMFKGIEEDKLFVKNNESFLLNIQFNRIFEMKNTFKTEFETTKKHLQ